MENLPIRIKFKKKKVSMISPKRPIIGKNLLKNSPIRDTQSREYIHHPRPVVYGMFLSESSGAGHQKANYIFIQVYL